MRKYVVAACCGVLALAAAATVAIAGENQGVEYTTKYSTTRSEASTGFRTVINSEGTKDATGKPRATRRVLVVFHRGTEFNTSVKPTCTKAALEARGLSGCSSRTRVGTKRVNAGPGNERADGKAEAVTGLAAIDPVNVGVYAFNKRNGLLLYIQPNTGEPGNPFVIDGTLRRNRLTVTVPRLPQPTPFGEAILTKFEVAIGAFQKGRGRGAQFYAETPACPRGRKWETEYTATYDDGSVKVEDDISTCRRR